MENSSNEISRRLLNITTVTSRAVDSLVNGEVDPISFATNIAKLEKVLKSIKESKLVADIILSELDKYPQGIVLNGIKITQIEAGQKYDYSQCGDAKLLKLYDAQKRLDEIVKKREKSLKNLTGLTTIIDNKTGEILNLYPPKKTSKTTYKTTEVETNF